MNSFRATGTPPTLSLPSLLRRKVVTSICSPRTCAFPARNRRWRLFACHQVCSFSISIMIDTCFLHFLSRQLPNRPLVEQAMSRRPMSPTQHLALRETMSRPLSLRRNFLNPGRHGKHLEEERSALVGVSNLAEDRRSLVQGSRAHWRTEKLLRHEDTVYRT